MKEIIWREYFRITLTCVLIVRNFFIFIFTAIFTVSFIACYIIALTTCVPVNRSSPSWPCQKDKDVRKFLSEALITSRDLAGQASVLSNIMVSF